MENAWNRSVETGTGGCIRLDNYQTSWLNIIKSIERFLRQVYVWGFQLWYRPPQGFLWNQFKPYSTKVNLNVLYCTPFYSIVLCRPDITIILRNCFRQRKRFVMVLQVTDTTFGLFRRQVYRAGLESVPSHSSQMTLNWNKGFPSQSFVIRLGKWSL